MPARAATRRSTGRPPSQTQRSPGTSAAAHRASPNAFRAASQRPCPKSASAKRKDSAARRNTSGGGGDTSTATAPRTPNRLAPCTGGRHRQEGAVGCNGVGVPAQARLALRLGDPPTTLHALGGPDGALPARQGLLIRSGRLVTARQGHPRVGLLRQQRHGHLQAPTGLRRPAQEAQAPSLLAPRLRIPRFGAQHAVVRRQALVPAPEPLQHDRPDETESRVTGRGAGGRSDGVQCTRRVPPVDQVESLLQDGVTLGRHLAGQRGVFSGWDRCDRGGNGGHGLAGLSQGRHYEGRRNRG